MMMRVCINATHNATMQDTICNLQNAKHNVQYEDDSDDAMEKRRASTRGDLRRIEE